ncbi:precorrin-6A synthase (deacetylating) [Rhizobium sp. SG2393]|uniref:precorrin-6A synthase (deacetylating) n=1 Tax=Rhizobium sp. SG2393 TaxID=3276279 RepID=UPI00366DE1D4
MKTILVIGIGTGNPDHLTIEAVKALNAADTLFIPLKGEEKAGLAEVRREICRQHVTRADSRQVEFSLPKRQAEGRAYVAGVDDWHAAIAATYEALFAREIPEGGTGGLLVWGDPMLYDSTIRILNRVAARGNVAFKMRVIPGITSVQTLCAAHGIPLNLVGKPVEITTGRRLKETFPQRSESAVVMLDGEQAFMAIDDPDARIYWGAYLGTADEIVIAGRLAEVRDEILVTRQAARARHGWIMDIYLLQKGEDFDDRA